MRANRQPRNPFDRRPQNTSLLYAMTQRRRRPMLVPVLQHRLTVILAVILTPFVLIRQWWTRNPR